MGNSGLKKITKFAKRAKSENVRATLSTNVLDVQVHAGTFQSKPCKIRVPATSKEQFVCVPGKLRLLWKEVSASAGIYSPVKMGKYSIIKSPS